MSFFQCVGYDSPAISRPIFYKFFKVTGLGLLWITHLMRKKWHNSAKDGLRNPAPSSKKYSRFSFWTVACKTFSFQTFAHWRLGHQCSNRKVPKWLVGFLHQPGGCSPVKLLGFTCFMSKSCTSWNEKVHPDCQKWTGASITMPVSDKPSQRCFLLCYSIDVSLEGSHVSGLATHCQNVSRVP